ncbi:AraC family transcriptional regulator [Burkholderia stabilis]|uniref:helix-turn-helix domain-containing protein n=1 Tax=Burkholderia stabilis TaxID=95485 RepID=UPI000851736B|nr:helix-turn-helix domain-containing protein [Burkholderia stabilis]AOR72009.1 AraC family transcriptional regulator [Burkholderia stabilis]HDR9488726.1 helix-turn-helix domain-containing protein [Burkholderia stabilis]HDR9523617.1 helix-turn-helix domain-containing protein [Burkholderia stabilis]HDR9531353.1 helix-turn-helix domain-containing protein [Burkholderia stabilis]HDR9540971.1 helix-turn-helix domain-containing protein [Burkholderia stabilis]
MAQAARLGEAFNLANRLHAFNADYQLKYVSESGGLLQSSSGVRIAADPLGDEHGRRALAFFHLHGERAAVNWNDALQRRLTDIREHARWIFDAMDLPALAATQRPSAAIHVRPGGVGRRAAAAVELQAGETDVFAAALDMFRVDLGDSAAQEIASNMLRPIEQRYAQSMWAFRELSASPSIRMSAQRLRAQSVNRISIANAAQAAAMSERNFLRRFKKEIGVTPTEFVQHVRLERACHMLIHTTLPADKVARRTGFGSGERLAKLFRQRLLMSPTEFRVAEREKILTHGAASPEADEGAAAVLCDSDGMSCDACVAAREKTGRIPVKSSCRDLDPRFPCPSSPLPPPPLSVRRK